jgi:hypothetical protein
MKKKHHCRPGSKRFAECQTAALEIIEVSDGGSGFTGKQSIEE